MRINVILNAIGTVLKYAGLFLFLPIIVALIFKEYYSILPFVISCLTSIIVGFLLTINKVSEKEINSTNKKEALAIVFFVWLVFSLICSIPYLFFNFSFVDSLFESISGITTTGATIITDFSRISRALFFFRSMSQWIGGMGIIVLFIAILPQFSVAGRQMFFGEAPVPLEEKITPRIKTSASWLWSVYILLTFIEILLLIFVGRMDLYSAICTSFSTLSSGGFSHLQNSIAGFASNKVSFIVMIFMFISGINFLLQYKIFIQKKIRLVFKSEEFKTYLGITLISGVSIGLILIFRENIKPLQAFLDSFFQTISIMTTTGFSSTNYENWAFDSKVILFVLMFTGACAGSTSGGVKIIRLVFVYKYLKNEISKIIHPSAIYPIKIENSSIAEDTKAQLISFIIFYFVLYGVSVFLIALIEKNTLVAITGSISTLGNIGPGFGKIIGHLGDYGSLRPISKIIFSFNMLIGRLELIPFLALLHPDLWHKK